MPESHANARNGAPVLVFDEGGARGGVVLVSELWGLDEALRGWAARLANEGYTVVAPDLWWRHPGVPPLGTHDEVRAGLLLLDDGLALQDIAAAAALLPAGRPRVVIGFCVGGLYARMASAAVPGLAAAVEFYGRLVYPTLGPSKPTQPLDLLPGRACPLLCHYGADDPICPPHHVDELERRLSAQAAAGRVYRYPGATHGFMNHRRPGGSAATAELAWSRTLRFLDEVLE